METMGNRRYSDSLTESDNMILRDIQKKISEIDNKDDLRTVHFLVRNYKAMQVFFRAMREINSQ